MATPSIIFRYRALLLALAAAGPLPANAQVDANAAQALAKKSDCFKCHSIDKGKKAPAYRKIAAALKGRPDGEDRVIKHITSEPKVRLDDGSEEEHPIIDTTNPQELRNLARWILSQ